MLPSWEGNHVTLLFLLLPGLAQHVKHVLQHGEPGRSGAGRAGPWLMEARPQALALLGRPVSVTGTRPWEAPVWDMNACRGNSTQTARTGGTAGSTCMRDGDNRGSRVHGLWIPRPLDGITLKPCWEPQCSVPGHPSQANRCQREPCFHLLPPRDLENPAFLARR